MRQRQIKFTYQSDDWCSFCHAILHKRYKYIHGHKLTCFYGRLFQIEGSLVRASSEAPCCFIEQDTLITICQIRLICWAHVGTMLTVHIHFVGPTPNKSSKLEKSVKLSSSENTAFSILILKVQSNRNQLF